MNILQVQNTLKDLSDGQLQKQMLNPDGSAPSFLVLSELQRRKDLRAGYAEHQASGKSMAEEYAKGVGGADVGQYSPAMRAATNPGMSPEMDANPDQPMQGESPMQTQGPPAPQGYADGGEVDEELTPAELSARGQRREYARGLNSLRRQVSAGENSLADEYRANRRQRFDDEMRPDMTPEDILAEQTMAARQQARLRGYAGGGVVKLADGGFLDFFMPNFQKGMQLGQQAANPSMTATTGRRYLGPGTPSPRGIENLYFDYGAQPGPGAPPDPNAPGSTPMGVQAALMPQMFGGAMQGGSANGATGAAGAGSVGAAVGEGASVSGGEAGTVGASVGGNAGTAASADAGDGDGSGTYKDGGPVLEYDQRDFFRHRGMLPQDQLPPMSKYEWDRRLADAPARRGVGSVMPQMDEENADRNVPDVPDSYVQDTRTMKQKFDDAMRVPSKDMGSALVESIRDAPTDYPGAARGAGVGSVIGLPTFTRDPDASMGETWARRNRGVGRVDTNVGEATSPFLPPGAGQGYAGPEPMDAPTAGGRGFSGPEPMGLDNVGQAQATDPTDPGGVPLGPPGPAGRDGVVLGGGLPSGPGSRRSGINVGGAGLQDYYDQVRAMSPPDGFDEIAKRNQADRDELKGMRKENSAMAMIAAGLGIAGGDSPYFAVNVGKGGQAGVKAWQEGDKEIRLASRDIRNAENQITIAKANRDERQLEKATTLYARGQENEQRGLDRQANAAIRAADRTEALRLKEMEIKETSADRKERLEESRVTHLGTLAQRSEHDASIAATKLAALKQGDPMETPTDKEARMARIAEAQTEMDTAKRQGEYQRQRYNDAVNDREISKGRLTKVTSGDHMRELKAKGKLKSGDRIIRPDGQLGTVD